MNAVTYDRPEETWDRYDDQAPDPDRMPGRPRRRYFNRVSAGVAALVMCAVGFYAGVRVEKSQVSNAPAAASSAASGFAARARALASGSGSRTGAGAPGAPGATGGAGASFGTVSSVRGGTLYVTETSGNTVKIKLSSATKISKSVSVGKKAIRPGDTVVVQGLAGKNGTVTAASVSDSGTGSNGIGGLFGGGGAGGAGGSGSTGGAGGSSGSSAKSAVGSLFSSGGGG